MKRDKMKPTTQAAYTTPHPPAAYETPHTHTHTHAAYKTPHQEEKQTYKYIGALATGKSRTVHTGVTHGASVLETKVLGPLVGTSRDGSHRGQMYSQLNSFCETP